MRLSLKFLLLIVLTSLGCNKEKECNPACGPLQQCADGVCTCGDDQFLLGNTCIEKCPDCFEGAFDCGCTDKYIIDTFEFNSNNAQVTLRYNIPGTITTRRSMTEISKIEENTYRFNIPRSCDIGDKKSTHIEFTVDKSDSSKLDITARYYIFQTNETLGTCSSLFKK